MRRSDDFKFGDGAPSLGDQLRALGWQIGEHSAWVTNLQADANAVNWLNRRRYLAISKTKMIEADIAYQLWRQFSPEPENKEDYPEPKRREP